MSTFTAQVDSWARKSEARLDAVRKESVQRLITIILTPTAKGGRTRVDTGFLRSSFMASTAAMPQLTRDNPGGSSFSFNESPVAVAIAGWQAGQTLYGGFTASYAAHREYGARGQPADLMVTMAAQRWQSIVAEVAREARSRAGA